MKSKKCSRRQKFLHLLKKLRYYIFATLVLLVAGIVFFFFLRRVLLESYQPAHRDQPGPELCPGGGGGPQHL